MRISQLISRRPTEHKADFRPDVAPESPSAQMRRLNAYLQMEIPPPEDIEDCSQALYYLREYTYRKIFTGTTHQEYKALDQSEPEAIDWLISVHEAEYAAHAQRTSEKRTR